MKIDSHELYKPEEVAKYLKVHKITVIRKCKDGSIVCLNVGTEDKPMYRISGYDINNFTGRQPLSSQDTEDL